MNLFYTTTVHADFAELSEEESFHCIRVLRMQAGDPVQFVDGHGGYYEGLIENANPRQCTIRITGVKRETGKRAGRLHVAMAPTKSIDRFEWFLEKATEIGIEEITPLICRHSERRDVKVSRLEKVLVSAMKQSLKAYLPKLNEAVSFDKLIRDSSAAQKFICTMSAAENLKDRYQQTEDSIVLIGPEGDFSEEEITQSSAAGFLPVQLGPSRLRTETAGIVVCSIVSLLQ